MILPPKLQFFFFFYKKTLRGSTCQKPKQDSNRPSLKNRENGSKTFVEHYWMISDSLLIKPIRMN